MTSFPRSLRVIAIGLSVSAMLAACSPTVKLQIPDKPITINMNIKIEQEVRVRLEKGVEEVIKTHPGIF